LNKILSPSTHLSWKGRKKGYFKNEEVISKDSLKAIMSYKIPVFTRHPKKENRPTQGIVRLKMKKLLL